MSLSLVLAGCGDWPWPLDNPLDPGRCEPGCGPGQHCVGGTCRGADAGPPLDLSEADLALDGPLADRPVIPPPPDGPRPERRPHDGPRPDARTPDRALPADLPPPDRAPAPDTVNPCPGLICPLGCNASLKRCKRLWPSNVDPKPFYSAATGQFRQTGKSLVFDSDTGAVTLDGVQLRPANRPGAYNGVYWKIYNQSGGYPQLSVFAADDFIFPAGMTVQIVGSRAFLLYARQNITLAGDLYTLPTTYSPGAGGYRGGYGGGAGDVRCGVKAGQAGHYCGGHRTGGGGGGHKRAGGNGGKTTNTACSVGAGGLAASDPDLVPLAGGCGGGGGGQLSINQGGHGGGGGGAIQLSAGGTLTISGRITAPGGGGGGGAYYGGGGGGGAGGSVLLEGVSVKLSGTVAANGGGGGAAGYKAKNGEMGKTGRFAASGGQGGTGYGSGASGGSFGQEAGKSAASANSAFAGGGGGAAGQIRLNGITLNLASALTSPAHTYSHQLKKW